MALHFLGYYANPKEINMSIISYAAKKRAPICRCGNTMPASCNGRCRVEVNTGICHSTCR